MSEDTITPKKRSRPKYAGQIRHDSIKKALDNITDTLSQIHLSTVDKIKTSRGHK